MTGNSLALASIQEVHGFEVDLSGAKQTTEEGYLGLLGGGRRPRAGDIIYIPANVPHLPINNSDAPVSAVIARTDPNEQESVTLLPELEALVAMDF